MRFADFDLFQTNIVVFSGEVHEVVLNDIWEADYGVIVDFEHARDVLLAEKIVGDVKFICVELIYFRGWDVHFVFIAADLCELHIGYGVVGIEIYNYESCAL